MPAADRTKLRMKIGAHEFEAEGPREFVLEQLEVWMRAAGVTVPAREYAERASTGAAIEPAVRDLFRIDPERRLVVLRVRIPGRRRNADAALALLYGFDHCFGAGDGADVPAAQLRDALAASGHPLPRVDRILASYVVAGLVRKAGSHKHETYGLTAHGSRRAALLLRSLAPPRPTSS